MKRFFQRNPRLGGLVGGIMTVVLSKFFIFDVVNAARTHSTDVHLSMRIVVICAAMFQLSMLKMIFGGIFGGAGTKNLSPIGWVLVIIVFGISFGFYFWFKSYIESFGYKFD